MPLETLDSLTFDGRGLGLIWYRYRFLTLLCTGIFFHRTCVDDIFSPHNLLFVGSYNVGVTLPTFTGTSYCASLVKLPYIHPLGFFFRWLFEWMSVHGYPLDIIPFEDWYKRYRTFFSTLRHGCKLKLFSLFQLHHFM